MEKTRVIMKFSLKNKSLEDLVIKLEVAFILITLLGFYKLVAN